jgi:hypothetical protein
MDHSTLSLIVKAIMMMMVMDIALGSFADSDSDHASSAHQNELRGIIANKMKAISEASGVKSMYIAGTGPFCNGGCENGDVTLVGSLWGEYWSGNTDAYGVVCVTGTKALCLSSSGTSGTLWNFPMCEPQGICTVEKGCTGCPTGTQKTDTWPETNGVRCCSESYRQACLTIYAAASCSVV